MKSWVHAERIDGRGGEDVVSGRDDALLTPVGGISNLLCQMKEL